MVVIVLIHTFGVSQLVQSNRNASYTYARIRWVLTLYSRPCSDVSPCVQVNYLFKVRKVRQAAGYRSKQTESSGFIGVLVPFPFLVPVPGRVLDSPRHVVHPPECHRRC